jgi:pimeloyl-ACP methyl ester carboxylesterase
MQDEALEVACLPIGLEKLTYLKISLLLNRQTNLYEFPYDWRRPIETNADLLHAAIERWAAGDPTRPFFLVGHSMGGLVARSYLARHPMAAAQHVQRVILLGTPHFGAANAVDGLLNGNSMMATVDKLNAANEMRQLVFTLPSIYQILPAPPDLFPVGRKYPFDFDLYQAAAWGLPEIRQDYLDAARHFHQSLAAADPQVPITIIAGCHIETAVGARLGSAAPRLLLDVVAEGDESGDGTVPLWSARLPGAQVYYIQAVHAKLPADGAVIRATLDLIQSGACDLPTTLPPPRKSGFLPGLPFAPEVAAADLRLKVENGVAGEDDLRCMFFAL